MTYQYAKGFVRVVFPDGTQSPKFPDTEEGNKQLNLWIKAVKKP
jgi:hypothetical protein